MAPARIDGQVLFPEREYKDVSSLLQVGGLEKNFDGIRALADFSFSIVKEEVVGLIGPNGAGKTTFFNVLTGFLKPEGGKAHYNGIDILRLSPYRVARLGIARTFQILRLIRQLSVLDNVLLAFPDQLGERLGNIFFRPGLCKRQEKKNRETALALLSNFGLTDKAHDPANALSYGQQKLLSLVCCLATGAELLLLDEPVAGIAPERIDQILKIIRSLPEQGKTVILVEHNLDAVMQVCDRVIFMDAGRKISEGTPEEVRNDPRVIEAYID